MWALLIRDGPPMVFQGKIYLIKPTLLELVELLIIITVVFIRSAVNAHPHRSDDDNSFVLVHNGIITNYKDIKVFLTGKGHCFESDTDTEVVAKLMAHIYQQHPDLPFRELVEQAIAQLVWNS